VSLPDRYAVLNETDMLKSMDWYLRDRKSSFLGMQQAP
jgi:hypothetical protein